MEISAPRTYKEENYREIWTSTPALWHQKIAIMLRFTSNTFVQQITRILNNKEHFVSSNTKDCSSFLLTIQLLLNDYDSRGYCIQLMVKATSYLPELHVDWKELLSIGFHDQNTS